MFSYRLCNHRIISASNSIFQPFWRLRLFYTFLIIQFFIARLAILHGGERSIKLWPICLLFHILCMSYPNIGSPDRISKNCKPMSVCLDIWRLTSSSFSSFHWSEISKLFLYQSKFVEMTSTFYILCAVCSLSVPTLYTNKNQSIRNYSLWIYGICADMTVRFSCFFYLDFGDYLITVTFKWFGLPVYSTTYGNLMRLIDRIFFSFTSNWEANWI